MHKLFVIFFISFAIVLFNGCASMSQPVRVAYIGADNVGTVNPEILIGNWNIRLLNPIEGEEMQKLTSTYTSDGTVVMNAQPSVSANPMENIMLEITGTWSIEGENVVLHLSSMRETSGNKIASLMVGILGSNMRESLSGTANIYEASSDRIVLVSTEGGQAQEWTRICLNASTTPTNNSQPNNESDEDDTPDLSPEAVARADQQRQNQATQERAWVAPTPEPTPGDSGGLIGEMTEAIECITEHIDFGPIRETITPRDSLPDEEDLIRNNMEHQRNQLENPGVL